jgi:hypothetical protein
MERMGESQIPEAGPRVEIATPAPGLEEKFKN